MSEHTRRHFLEVAAATAAATLLAPPALAAPRVAPGAAAPTLPVGLAAPRRPGRPVRHLPVRDLHRRDERGHRADLHHEPVRPRSRCGGRAVRGRAPASARLGGRRAPPYERTRGRCPRGGSSRGCSSTAPSATSARRCSAWTMPAPVILGPVGRQALAHPDGEIATARAAAGLELTYVHSSRASRSLEEVAAAAPDGPRWFGLDWPDGGGPDPVLLTRAQAAGCTHLVLSPPQPGQGWEALAAIRKAWDGPIVLGGIQNVPDARMAVRRGLDGIVVSNERGRRGPGVAGTIRVLPQIADAVGGKLAVLFGSGARTGTDVLPGAGPGGRRCRHRPPVRARPGARRGGRRPAHAPNAPRRARDHPHHRWCRAPPRPRRERARPGVSAGHRSVRATTPNLGAQPGLTRLR